MLDQLSKTERDKLIGALYETVLHPDKYDELMEAWSCYLQPIFAEQIADPSVNIYRNVVKDDDLGEHFRRGMMMLEKALWVPEPVIGSDANAKQKVVLLISKHQQIIDKNQAACELLGAKLDFDGFLDLIDTDGVRRLRKALTLVAKENVKQFRIFLTLISLDDRPLHFAVSSHLGDDGQYAVLLESLSIPWCETLEVDLSEAFELSPAEVMIVRDIAAGQSLAEIAEQTDRSIYTVRAHIKSALKKTNSPRQTDLVRLVSLMSQVINARDSRSPAIGSGHSKISHISLPDGRKMEVYTLGAETGVKVIFIHGMLDGIEAIKRIAESLAEKGLQFICPIRAGFGNSDPHMSSQAAPEIFAADLMFVMKKMRIYRPILVGHMSGAVYAFCAARRFEQDFAAIVNISGGVPIISRQQFDSMAPRQKVVAYTARYVPALLPTLLGAGISQINMSDSTKFLEALYMRSGHDRLMIEKLNLKQLLFDGYRLSIQQGHGGFAADAYQVTRDWSDFVAIENMPICHIHGVHDPVVSIESVRKFAVLHQKVKLVECADFGQLLFYEKPSLVLDAILEFSRH